MPDGALTPFLAFVWQPEDLNRTVLDMSRSAATVAIFDLSRHNPREFSAALKDACATHIKISPDAFLDPGLPKIIEETGIDTLWVEYHPSAFPGDAAVFLRRLGELKNLCRVVPISGDLSFLRHMIGAKEPPEAVALKGSEAAGLVSSETLGILYAALEQESQAAPQPPRLIAWGGVGTPEAAAAFLATGALGVVMESLHWLTDLVTATPELKGRLTKLTPEHTTLVGASLGVPCRVFDKGNSQAVRDLRTLVNRLLGEDDLDAARRTFTEQVLQQATPALESALGRHELIFLGPEATFADAFAKRFGTSTRKAMAGFVKEVDRLLASADIVKDSFQHSPAAKDLGTTYPFFQGAMTWISDNPDFAKAVADAGGLPAIAMGLRDRKILERDLGQLKKTMNGRPYAINIIALQENPVLDDQLAWVAATRPPLAVIAAGDPAYAQKLQQQGIPVCYIAPNEGLLRLALQAGARWVILEGHEAGGHVGSHSTLTLAQMVLALKRREPGLFKNSRVVLAGGIYNRATAFRAAMLGADALQMGTVYLATKEIVDTGALSPLYQQMILEAQPGDTTVSGETVGLGVRSLRTPKMEAILALEREFAAGKEEEASFRRRLEAMGARTLLIAARSVQEPGGKRLDESTCRKEGQFMSGAVAGSISKVLTLAELHQELAAGPLTLAKPHLAPMEAPAVLRPARPAGNGHERVAITGMALVNALGNSPREIWENSVAMKSGIIEVPPEKWDHSFYYDPDPRAPEKTYCKVGAFQNIDINRKELGIPPQDFRTMSNSTRLTLWLAHHALADSGLLEADIPRERIAVLISQNSGEVASTLRDLVVGLAAPHMVQSVGNIVSLSPLQAHAAEDYIKSTLIRVDDTTLLGRLNCTAGGFICNKYGFRGPSFSVSAACATSLVALYAALLMIKNGVIDAAVVGGGEETLTPAHFLEFSALGALAGLTGNSRLPQQMSRPFDRYRDGMVLGEGGPIIVIERESVARRRGAKVHAYITGMGASNSDQGMVESLAETQEIAIKAAFADAGYGPETVDLVECHATATIQGDGEEVHALKSFFPQGRTTHLTSFKSQIGHTLGASGLNSLIRGVMAMQSGIMPPSLNYETPDPQIELEEWGFRVPTKPEDWPRPHGNPRRLMVNAFGFGGANYVVQLEENLEGAAPVLVSLPEATAPEEHLPLEDKAHQVNGISFLRGRTGDATFRISILADNDQEALKKAAGLKPLEVATPLTDKDRRRFERQGIFLGQENQPEPPLALVFAGQGTYYAGMGKELYDTFPPIKLWMDRMAEVADFDLLHLLFYSRDENLQRTLWQQPALFTLNYSVVRYLLDLGLVPAAMAGHSLGELVALSVAGVFSYEDGFRIVHKRAQCMDKAGDIQGDPGTMVAVNVPLDILEEKVAARDNVYFTNYNSPRQIVIGGGTKEVLAFKEELSAEGYWTYPLKVSMAFHSPIMRVIRDDMQAFVDTIEFHPPQIPVISNTTMKPYPDDPAEIKRIVMSHLESPVHWLQNVQTLWNDMGVRVFVEVGPKDTLCNLVTETVPEALTMPTCDPEGEALTFRHAAARLYAMGFFPAIKPLTMVDLSPAPAATAPAPRPAAPLAAADVAAIIQREINAFVLGSFGKYLKPAILEALRREVNPAFTEAELDQLLGDGVSSAPAPAMPAPARPAAAPILPSPAPAAPAPAAAAPAPAVSAAPLAPEDYLERIIQIIMDATGYEREEIEPDMDLRQDLAIRSSRLPVIMDAAEREFHIAIRIDDFLGVRTVQDLADRLAEVVARDGAALPSAEGEAVRGPIAPPVEPVAAAEIPPEAPADLEPCKRMVFRAAPLPESASRLLQLRPGKTVAVLHLGPESNLSRDAMRFCNKTWQSRTIHFDIAGSAASPEHFDLRTAEGGAAAAKFLAETPELAGLIITLDGEQHLTLAEVPAMLTGLFQSLQSLMSSPVKEFCVLLTRNLGPAGSSRVLAEGVLGMFLAAAQEYPEFLFRSVSLDADTDIKAALPQALDTAQSLIQIIYRGSQALTRKAVVEPAPFRTEPALRLDPGDVVVMSGGARGVTPLLAKALAPLSPRLALLGRTKLDPEVDYDALLRSGADEAALRRFLKKRQPDIAGSALEKALARLRAGLEVARTLKDLALLGVEARYFPCDVAQAESVHQTISQVVGEWGRIDVVIHGAGVIHDSFVAFLSPEDFHRVVAVKLAGAANLLAATKPHGLRCLAAFSSAAAIQGNPGQANYCAGNRAMSALLATQAPPTGVLLAKAFMLPPVEGVGMADDPEVKELLKLKGLEKAYVHAEELVQLLVRELFLGNPQDVWVMPMRLLPQVKTTLLDTTEPQMAPGSLSLSGIAAEPEDLPMLDTVQRLDLRAGELEAERIFLSSKDLWLDDHRPFKFLKHPPVSGIMAVETFFEAARLLNPHLHIVGARQVAYRDLLDCPLDQPRVARIHCRTMPANPGELLCQVTISSPLISPSGRELDRWTTNFAGQVILGSKPRTLNPLPGFPVKPEEMETRPMVPDEVANYYETRTSMQGRYRVMESLEGTGPGCIRGAMIYREIRDFPGEGPNHYQFSPYLLEAFLHLANFYVVMRDEQEERRMIPAGIGELLFTRNCKEGERLILEARLQNENPESNIWVARALDETGTAIMQVSGLQLRWFVE
jgi:acyl transferase domain-containing protein/NAD(P)H-dependent flavin oxidoreductase YrpB (nitropropane dioxygenase family)/NAD(P)-dependent dehydrogenase (short-subunit alcohol dehydrogenase family)/acyl carrier protein|uniref:SDR family NAD(P)-dependent oxidoreductase n=1 Tax=Desulfobacca acetoxidans TaxID=60893 RepID=A0A7V6A1L5_9BACT